MDESWTEGIIGEYTNDQIRIWLVTYFGSRMPIISKMISSNMEHERENVTANSNWTMEWWTWIKCRLEIASHVADFVPHSPETVAWRRTTILRRKIDTRKCNKNDLDKLSREHYSSATCEITMMTESSNTPILECQESMCTLMAHGLLEFILMQLSI